MRPPSGLAPPRRSREPGRYRMRARAPSCRCTSKATSSQLASPDGSNRWTRRGAALRRAAPFEPQRATDAFCGSTLLLNATRTHQHTLFVEFKNGGCAARDGPTGVAARDHGTCSTSTLALRALPHDGASPIAEPPRDDRGRSRQVPRRRERGIRHECVARARGGRDVACARPSRDGALA